MSATQLRSHADRRQRVQALLAYRVELLLGDRVDFVSLEAMDSPWDIWWVCVRSGRSATEVGIDPRSAGGSCQRCDRQVRALTAATPGRPTAAARCGCMERWAKEMRRPGAVRSWPELRAQVAMIKPGADVVTIRSYLTETYAVVSEAERQLTSLDVARLYPDAYGAAYIDELTRYLTSGPVHVLVLTALPSARPASVEIKSRIREALGGTDPFQNHLHMPDNPGEALCDIEHLAGAEVLHRVYERYDGDRTHNRLVRYRDLLAR